MAEPGSSEMKARRIELIIQQLDSLPTLPAVATRLLEATMDEASSARELVRLIESDQSLTAKILWLVRRAHSGVASEAATISKAVVLLGFEAVRNAVLSIEVFETLGVDRPDGTKGAFDRVEFWKHSLAVACGAEAIAESLQQQIDEAFVCGLLHDIGKVALDAVLPKSFDRVVQIADSTGTDIADVEQRLLGIDHTVVGKRLAERWQLPQVIRECIWLHHQPLNGLPESISQPRMVQIVELADAIARRQRIGYSGTRSSVAPVEDFAAVLGLQRGQLEKIIRELPRQIEQRAAILGLGDVDAMSIYYHALQRANIELGRVNDSLQQSNRRLAAQADYFRMLEWLSGSANPASAVWEACAEVGRAWLASFEAGPCAVYLFDGDGGKVDGAVVADPKKQPRSFTLELNDAQRRQMAGLRSAGAGRAEDQDALQWFFESVGVDFDPATTRHVPATLHAKLVGGLLWQGADAEPADWQPEQLRSLGTVLAMWLSVARERERLVRLGEEMAVITRKLQQTHQQLLRARSLASVGEMAAGAAHEINNPLAIISGRLQLLLSQESDPKRSETLRMLVQQAHRISEIVSELMAFARPGEPNPTLVDVQQLIEQAVARVSERLQQDVRFRRELEPDVPPVYVDGEQIAEALANLLENAADAYDSPGGVVWIKAGFIELAGQVYVEVRDEGRGMDAETQLRAFAPFFSGRLAGRKRGLGLPKAHRLVENNAGAIDLDSEPGRGTRVRVILPIAPPEQRDSTTQAGASSQQAVHPPP